MSAFYKEELEVSYRDKLFIPRIIHLTWKDHNIPDVWKETIPAWKRIMPEWKIMFWTDAMNREYIQKKYSWFLSTYDGFPYNIQRADAIRYFLLRDFGGIYSDMDIKPLKNIETYLTGVNADVILVKSGNLSQIYTNSFMASPKNSHFWNHVIQYMIKGEIPWYAQFTRATTVLYSTGPHMLTKIVQNYKRPIALLPSMIFNAYGLHDNYSIIKPDAALLPLQGSSWITGFERVLYGTVFKTYVLYKWHILVIVLLMFFLNSKIKQKQQPRWNRQSSMNGKSIP